jgi:ribose transport system permease protein
MTARHSRLLALPVMLAVTCLLIALYEPRFMRLTNIMNVLRNASFLTVISAGQMLVMVVGGFDISVGAVAALTSVSVALAMAGLTAWGMGSALAVVVLGCLIGLLPALAIGTANGWLVSALKISPFMVTIGTMSIAAGLASYVTGGTPVYGLPELFTDGLGRGMIFQIPYAVFVGPVIVLLIWYVQTQTRAGRYFYAAGGNEKAARQSGVRTGAYIWAAYVASALLAGLVGILLTARVGSGEATLAGTLMLQSISVAVIGGVSLGGGVGRIEAVLVSAVFMSVLSNAMSLVRLDSKYHVIVIGLVVLAAVWFESRGPRKENRHG